jgi:GNAT superfamily N-acetyltransferase
MVSALPERPSLEYLRKRAKDLLKAHDARDPSCCEVLRALRRFAQADDAAILSARCGLQEVQFALALSYGFRNWDHLKAYVESLTPVPPDQQQDIQVRPIRRDELDRIVLRCWPPDRDELLRLFDEQGTIGMAAWEGPKCVGVVHGYRRDDPRKPSHLAPPWARGPSADDLPPATREAALSLPVPIWSFSCYHVGRTLVSFREEILSLVHRFAPRDSWDPVRTTAALNQLDAVKLEVRQVEAMMAELRRTGARRFVVDEPRYYSRGIGTALCKAAAQWARDNGYAAAVGGGAPEGLFKYAVWAGSLPHTAYAKLGFRRLGPLGPEDQLPGWARGNSPPDVMRQVAEALREGRPTASFHSQLMAKTF